MPAACAAEIETLLNARFDYTCCMRNFLNARLDWSLSTKACGHDLAMVTGALLAPHMTEYTAKIHEMGTICWYLVTIPIRPIKCLWVTSFYIYSIIVYHSLRPCLEWRLKECQTVVLLTSLCVWFGGIGKELSIGTVEKHVLLQETKNELLWPLQLRSLSEYAYIANLALTARQHSASCLSPMAHKRKVLSAW